MHLDRKRSTFRTAGTQAAPAPRLELRDVGTGVGVADMTGPEDACSFAVPLVPTSVGGARDLLRDWLRRSAVHPAVIEDAALVLSELVTNAIRHARPTATEKASVELRLAQRELQLAVTDGGGATVPTPVASSSRVPGEPGGWGLALVELLAHRWWWEPAENGRTVHVVLQLPAGPEVP